MLFLSKKKKSNDALAIGVGIGVVIGVVQGYFTNNLVIGIVIGIVIGVVVLKKKMTCKFNSKLLC